MTDDLDDFPLLITLNTTNIPNLDLSATVGADVRFTDAVTGAELKYEVETWDAGTDTAKIWVKVPKITAESATDYIHVYYNYNGTATTTRARRTSRRCGMMITASASITWMKIPLPGGADETTGFGLAPRITAPPTPPWFPVI